MRSRIAVEAEFELSLPEAGKLFGPQVVRDEAVVAAE